MHQTRGLEKESEAEKRDEKTLKAMLGEETESAEKEEEKTE